MRHDMDKVIVERPRRGGRHSRLRDFGFDEEDGRRAESIRWRHTNRKWLNENLAPLKRYLQKQVGRPWDKVYSEICAGIDRRNTVQQHIHEHIGDFIAINVIDVDGVLHVQNGWRGLQPLKERIWTTLYVDPRTGLIRRNKDGERERVAQRERWRNRYKPPRSQRREIEPMLQLHRMEGIWYAVELANVQAADTAFDTIRKRAVKDCPAHDDKGGVISNLNLFGRCDLYAVAKRQLNARELREHDLVNNNA